jgi:hypothetical protein
MPIKNHPDQPAQSSHLFTLRLWAEDLGSGQTDWRGKVQHMNSGEARYFRDWLTLEAFVEELLSRIKPKGSHAGEAEETHKTSRET